MSLPGRPLTGLTVLVVEDSRFASEAVRLLCLRSGARIRRADSLKSATRHLLTYRPAVVIADMGLPDGNGAELIARIHGAEPRVPVILGLSGDPDNEAAAMAAGANGFLAKPVESLAVFQQAILSALPAESQPAGPRLLPDDVISPDSAALRDDLAHVAEVLSGATDTAAIDYIARFLAGVARSAHDAPLEQAATALARDHEAGHAVAGDLARISGLVQDRLAAVGEV
ncbi:MAG: response regulator [Paracoccus sp. (in: a-proteobacteria)]|uniref:response regulator n=1 Tax=Paracoccus sp. TaxID=267 RepID=UPI0026DF6F6F|nr:response regulator [Paracoccus sp. (in: a-proteobacteria)]MDO5613129.1 response regulator [Paracoccus sp. (in: a-proteobacteria)]